MKNDQRFFVTVFVRYSRYCETLWLIVTDIKIHLYLGYIFTTKTLLSREVPKVKGDLHAFSAV